MAGAGCKMRAKMRGTVLMASQTSSGQSERHVVTIGIAGPSGVGKSTLAHKLATALNSPITPICLDWFLISTKGVTTWETPETLDFDKLREHLQLLCSKISEASCVPQRALFGPDNKDVIRSSFSGQRIKGDAVPIVVEGFLLFHDVQLCNMFNAHLWIEADCETCMLRRRSRNKKRTKDSKAEFDKWYTQDVWPHFELYQDTQLANASKALILDGTSPMEDMLKISLDHCQRLLKKKRCTPAPPSAVPPPHLLIQSAAAEDIEEVAATSEEEAPEASEALASLLFKPPSVAPPPQLLIQSRAESRDAPEASEATVSHLPTPPSFAPPPRLLIQSHSAESKDATEAAVSQTATAHRSAYAPGTFLKLLGPSAMEVWQRLCRGAASDQMLETDETLMGQPQKRLRTDCLV